MSMICFIGQINDNDLKMVMENPKRTELLINGGKYFNQPKHSFFKKLFSKQKEEKQDLWKPDVSEPMYDVDKAWNGVHFILNGDAEEGEFPLNFIVSGGESIGDDIGYGPLRILFPKDVEALKFELDKITVKDFEARFDAEELKLNDIYPLTDHWVDEDKQWLTEVYDGLKSYVDKACSNKNSLFVAIV